MKAGGVRQVRYADGNLLQRYFREVAALGGDVSRLSQLNAKYAIDMQFDSVPALCVRFGLAFPL